MENLKKELTWSLYSFDISRRHYELSQNHIGFFQPFKNFESFRRQVKTMIVSPVIGAFTLAHCLLSLFQNIVNMAISVICLDPGFFIKSLQKILGLILCGIVTPLVACIVTVAAAVSLITRSIATLFGIDGGAFRYDPLSAGFLNRLPEHPLPGV